MPVLARRSSSLRIEVMSLEGAVSFRRTPMGNALPWTMR